MITWTEFERQQPALAGAGRRQFYQFGIGLAFLATIRNDGGPRVHPVCPVISPAGLPLLILGVPGVLRELGLDRALDAAQRQIRITAADGADEGGAALVHLDMPRWFGGQEEVPCLRDLAQALRARRR